MENTTKLCLADFDGNRINNFTLIRIVFAWLVLYGHSFAVQKVAGIKDPLNVMFQGSIWIGELAVSGFFAISGFLVAASVMNRSIVEYGISRILRIYPALLICVFSSVFFLGPLLTTLEWAEYFKNFDTYKYLRNALAFDAMQWTLPGVFETNTMKATNGSLWTLTVEVRCYCLLGMLEVFGLMRHKVIANFMILSLLLLGYYYFPDVPLLGKNHKWSGPSLYFLIGTFFYINRRSVILDRKIALFALVMVCYSFGKEWFSYVFPVCFVYLVLYVAYVTKYVNVDETIGDISYGIYIYAWPIQQSVAYVMPNGNAYSNTILCSAIVFILAYFSWRNLEKPMLMLKQRLLYRSNFNFWSSINDSSSINCDNRLN